MKCEKGDLRVNEIEKLKCKKNKKSVKGKKRNAFTIHTPDYHVFFISISSTMNFSHAFFLSHKYMSFEFSSNADKRYSLFFFIQIYNLSH